MTIMTSTTDDAATAAPIISEDPLIQGQRFCLVSFVGPDLRQKSEKMGMKVRGCYGSKQEAETRVKELHSIDPSIDIFLLEVGKWVVIPPDSTAIEDVRYQEQFLDDLFQGYREQQKQAQRIFSQRQDAVAKEGIDAHLLPHEKIPPPESI
jgi:hypothetical protein